MKSIDLKSIMACVALTAMLSACGGQVDNRTFAGSPSMPPAAPITAPDMGENQQDGNDDVEPPSLKMLPETSDFQVFEATLSDIHQAMTAGTLSCRLLVEKYLDRIAAYDRPSNGTPINSVITTNPMIMELADELDQKFLIDGFSNRPLHCAPVLLKDNFDTLDMPTTAASLSLENAQTPDDAFSVAGIKAAGGIILGKANLDEFAFGFTGSSSLGGLVHNPYDLTKGAGGSSSGTGASIAASFALFGTGSDTGGSIRVPSSVQALIGIRPSMRLISQDGIIPLAHFQDVGGPMCRVVEDCALLLEAMVGFDPGEFSGHYTEPTKAPEDGAVLITTAAEYQQLTNSNLGYSDGLDSATLDGVRIGVVRALFGSNQQVIAVIDRAIEAMRAAGAIIEDVEIEDLSSITGNYSSVSRWEFRDHLTEYLQSWSSAEDNHKRSFEEVAASLQYEQNRVANFALNGSSGLTRRLDQTYLDNVQNRGPFVRPRLQAALDNTDLQGNAKGQPYAALMYPSILSLAANAGSSPSAGSNNRLSPFSAFPALTMPAGFADTTPALPVGVELLGREFDEKTLIEVAYAYQELAKTREDLGRQPPTQVPALQ